MANTAFDHAPTITVPSPTVNNRVVTWNGTTGKVFHNAATVTINAGVVDGVTTLAASTSITSPTAVLTNGTNAYAITLNTGATAANYTITMPTAAPAAGKVLKTTSGSTSQLEWGDAGGGDLSFGGDAFGADKIIGSTDAYALSFETAGVVRMKIHGQVTDPTSAGAITMPTQPCFLTHVGTGTALTNVTGDNSNYTIIWNSEVFDVGENLSGSTFTAPVTGKYFMEAQVQLDGVTSSHTEGMFTFVTNNAEYPIYFHPYAVKTATSGFSQVQICALVDMTAGHTCVVKLRIRNGTPVVDINGSGDRHSRWSGYLVA